ncbi:hypothetical protein KC19_3G240300 [Ceratodon purpureus]|uniref:Uncharacterized protein n=1 Tax=Ceratodon purpureus TaxID=3225 RepID=A0A8T0INU8_CERPU|nr:hypothetical protein KC19_3G240300 [Ceratodon purpureus]
MAIGPGKTSPEIKALNRIAIATEKKLLSILVDGASVRFCLLVRKSRKQAQTYQRLYQEPILLLQLVRETAAVMQEFTQAGYKSSFDDLPSEIKISKFSLARDVSSAL